MRFATSPEEYIDRSSIPEPNSGCWLWTLRGDVGRYGRAKFQSRRMLAHRLSWLTFRGEIPDGKDVCHKCDTPECVNPAHLFLGTHKENMADMVKKNRQTKLRGEELHSSKLSEETVRHILESQKASIDVAREFGISLSLVSVIRRRVAWQHVVANIPKYQDGRSDRSRYERDH